MRPLIDEVSIWKKVFVIFLPLLFLALAPPILGKDFWEEKSYREWSERECRKMLQNSPWARDYTQRGLSILGTADRILSDGEQPYLKYQIQLRSALPVRQAIIRMAQINQKYDELKPEQKKMFDQQADSFLAQDLSEWVIVYLTYETNIPTLYFDITRDLKNRLLPIRTHLYGSKGDKVPVGRFVPPEGDQRSFQLIFPRKYKGKEILGSEDKSLKFEYGNIFMEFKTDKMKINGKVEY